MNIMESALYAPESLWLSYSPTRALQQWCLDVNADFAKRFRVLELYSQAVRYASSALLVFVYALKISSASCSLAGLQQYSETGREILIPCIHLATTMHSLLVL